MKSHAEKLLFPAGIASSQRLNHPGVLEIMDFLRGMHPGPTVSDFRIDVTSGRGSSWNLRACQVFSHDFSSRKYPEADGKTHVEAYYEFYRLLPSFLWHHAAAVGFERPEQLERFHERFAQQARKYDVWFFLRFGNSLDALSRSQKPASKLQVRYQSSTAFFLSSVVSLRRMP